MDNYIVSARKYRPATFHSVVGQKSLTATLKNAIRNNKLAHAYLFCGPRGVGKTTCARIFAKAINCFHLNSEGETCNTCESCLSFNEQRSYSIHELDAASNNSVDDIRSLIEQVRIPPQIGQYKVYIIDEVHMLSSSAFNAFLKTLEEPPLHAIFILATTEKHKILPTILSRCQIYDFNRIHVNDIVEYLEYVAQEEHIHAEKEALNIIAQKADGGMRDALSLFDQVVSFTNGNITYKTVIENLNVLDYEYYFKLTEAILSEDVNSCLLLLNEILSKGFDGQHLLGGLASFFRDLLVCKDPQTIVLFEVGDTVREKYLACAATCLHPFLYKAIEMANDCDLNYRISKNKRLLIELLLIRLCQLSTPLSSEEDKKKTLEPLTIAGKSEKQTEIQRKITAEEEKSTNIPSSGEEQSTSKSKISKPIINFSLKNPTNKQKEVEKENWMLTENVVSETIPFSQDELIQSWKSYANELKEKLHLKNTMLHNLPILRENHTIEVSVYNPEQAQKLQEETSFLTNYLRNKLRNNSIFMNITITEENKKQLAYTDSEKYQSMLLKNETLKNLVTAFQLRID